MSKKLKIEIGKGVIFLRKTKKTIVLLLPPNGYNPKGYEYILMTPDVERYFKSVKAAIKFCRKRNINRVFRKTNKLKKLNDVPF